MALERMNFENGPQANELGDTEISAAERCAPDAHSAVTEAQLGSDSDTDSDMDTDTDTDAKENENAYADADADADADLAEAVAAQSSAVFGVSARADFAANYPEIPHILDHGLAQNALLDLEALAILGEALPNTSIEYNRGDLPIGVSEKPGETGLSIGETIRNIETSGSWAVLKNIEQHAQYGALLNQLLEEIRPEIEAKTGAMLRPQGFIFISSPNAMTPYHFDPEHNILLQLRGNKVMTQFPAGDAKYAPDTLHESYHSGGARELMWEDGLLAGGREFAITSGQALFVPVMAPHFVRNGPESSISLSITWRSDWSFAEADARGMNRLIRNCGLSPKAPGRWPASNKAKAYAYRGLRKLGLLG